MGDRRGRGAAGIKFGRMYTGSGGWGGTPDRPCGLNIVMFMKTESPPEGRFKEPCSPYIYTPIKLPGWAPP